MRRIPSSVMRMISMTKVMRPEVLAPAGDRERLEAALLYGADAVYLSGTRFGMRRAPANFTEDELRDAVALCHRAGRQVYVTCNILPRNEEMADLPAYLELLDDIGADAVIAADPGVMALAKRYAPHCQLHVSTQLGVVNYVTAQTLYDMGASRVVLARELSLDEIAEIRAKTSPELELEAFVHGAMCMAYSGRCLLSTYLTGRDGNHGDCAQSCRWGYYLVEPTRPNQPLTIVEEQGETHLLNAYDLCMIEHIPALCRAGVSSFKIEGRAKAAFYVAGITNAYRQAVDGYLASGCAEDYRVAEWLREEPTKVSHRPYGTGFYFGMPEQSTSTNSYIRTHQATAVVTGYENGRLLLSQRNRFFKGDTLEVLLPNEPPMPFTVSELYDGEGTPIDSAPHPTMALEIPYDRPLPVGCYLRRKADD